MYKNPQGAYISIYFSILYTFSICLKILGYKMSWKTFYNHFYKLAKANAESFTTSFTKTYQNKECVNTKGLSICKLKKNSSRIVKNPYGVWSAQRSVFDSCL